MISIEEYSQCHTVGKMESTRQDQILGVYLTVEPDKLQDFLAQIQTKTKAKLGGEITKAQC